MREERKAKLHVELESLGKKERRERKKTPNRVRVNAYKKFRLFKDKIQTQIEDRLLGFKSQLYTMEARIQEMEKKNQ
jgi:hypothetical protein